MAPLRSWLDIPHGSHFSLANIPFGIISHAGHDKPRPAIAIGDYALDLDIFTAGNGFKDLSIIQPHSAVFSESTLNEFAALGQPMHSAVRRYIQTVFLHDTPYADVLKSNADLKQRCLIPLANIKSHLPMSITDYTDFYAGLNHAFNCGVIFRGPDNALQPNYKHLPVGYHGRASSVVVSGTPIRRPRGQILLDPTAASKAPVLAPSRRLDLELELAAFVCKPNALGEPVPVEHAAEHLFGLVLMNDWSARDIQAWEMVPLGPFNGKNFGTTISPWVVLMDALEPFKEASLPNDATVLPYLQSPEPKPVYGIELQVELTPHSGETAVTSKTNGRNLLYSFPQMLAHHTVGGCPFNVGDLLGSGTISGSKDYTFGSFLEQTRGGKESFSLPDGTQRKFLEDGDTLTITGVCGEDPEALVGFGQCTGTIQPSP